MGLTTLPCKKKIVEKPPRNSARFCGGGRGLSWAVEPKEEEEYIYIYLVLWKVYLYILYWKGSTCVAIACVV
jgi:hypothetical protein